MHSWKGFVLFQAPPSEGRCKNCDIPRLLRLQIFEWQQPVWDITRELGNSACTDGHVSAPRMTAQPLKRRYHHMSSRCSVRACTCHQQLPIPQVCLFVVQMAAGQQPQR